MGLVFVGDLENISDIQLGFIRDVLEKRGYKNTNVSLEVVGKDGDNYMANVKRVSVQDVNCEFKMIAKIAPQNEIHRHGTGAENLFENEHIMYTTVLPKFLQLQIDAYVPEEERLRFAKCYGCLSEPPHEVILLEDLNESNFIMLDRLQSMSDECVRSVLKNFGIFHSLSFVMKNKEPEMFRDVGNRLFDIWSNTKKVDDGKMFIAHIENQCMMMLQSEKHTKAVRGAITQGLSMAPKLFKSAINSKHSVIQQGDSWTNNIMFKFNGEQLLASIMIDYQLAKESNPAYDLLYMIFTCTDHKTRLQHYHDWIDFYHSELDKSLSNFGLKASFLYPRDQLDADLKRYGKVMFGLSIVLASVTTLKSDDASKIKESLQSGNAAEMANNTHMSDLDSGNNMMFKNKLEGLIDSYLEFGLL